MLFGKELGYKKSDIEDLTTNEFFEISEELSENQLDGYWMDLTKFAWLGQFISSLLGGESKVFEDMLKHPPEREKPKPSLGKQSDIGEWKDIAEKRDYR